MSSTSKTPTEEPKKKKKKPSNSPIQVQHGDTSQQISEAVREAMSTLYSPPQYYTQPPHGQYTPQPVHTTDITSMLQSLTVSVQNIEQKLSTLDNIEKTVSYIQDKVIQLELKISELDSLKQKVESIEQSTEFISEKFDEWCVDKQTINDDVKSLQDQVTRDSITLTHLQQDSIRLNEYMIDQRCQSMRDNLIFTAIPEANPEGGPEDTEAVLKTFIKGELKLDPCIIDFKRIHRIGPRKSQHDKNIKPRSIIAKFNVTTQKDSVKRAGRELKGKPFRIVEQFPDEIAAYRREVLYPLQWEARKHNKKAIIVVDKLYVNNVLQNTPLPPYRLPRSQYISINRPRLFDT